MIISLSATYIYAAGQQGSSDESSEGKIKVVVVTDKGGIGDQGFNDAGYRGLMQAAEDNDIEIKLIESSAVSEYETNLQAVGQLGYDLVFCMGSPLADPLRIVAPRFPKTTYVVIDGKTESDLKNVVGIGFREDHVSFLAGALAAKMTKTDTIGIVLGMKIPILIRYEIVFESGAFYANSKVRALHAYLGRFDDPGLGKETAFTLYGEGADIVAGAAGAGSLGVFDAAIQKGEGFWAMGAAAGQSHLAPEDIMADQVKRIDTTVYNLINEFLEMG